MTCHVRLAAVLAHTVPGVTLELRCAGGETLVVADGRLDAHLTTCQLRAALLVPRKAEHLRRAVCDVRICGGLGDLGAGVYGRTGDEGDERWLATDLPVDVLADVFDGCPVNLPDEAMAVNLSPDAELGTTALRITAAHPSYTCRLDEVALWAATSCAVEELVRGLGHEMSSR